MTAMSSDSYSICTHLSSNSSPKYWQILVMIPVIHEALCSRRESAYASHSDAIKKKKKKNRLETATCNGDINLISGWGKTKVGDRKSVTKATPQEKSVSCIFIAAQCSAVFDMRPSFMLNSMQKSKGSKAFKVIIGVWFYLWSISDFW